MPRCVAGVDAALWRRPWGSGFRHLLWRVQRKLARTFGKTRVSCRTSHASQPQARPFTLTSLRSWCHGKMAAATALVGVCAGRQALRMHSIDAWAQRLSPRAARIPLSWSLQSLFDHATARELLGLSGLRRPAPRPRACGEGPNFYLTRTSQGPSSLSAAEFSAIDAVLFHHPCLGGASRLAQTEVCSRGAAGGGGRGATARALPRRGLLRRELPPAAGSGDDLSLPGRVTATGAQ